MRKTRKFGIQKHKSKRHGRGKEGKESEVPFFLKSMLNDVHLRTYSQEFADNGNPSLVSYILQELPRSSVTEALENAPLKKEVTNLISQRLNQSAKSAKSNNYVIASKIINTIPTTHLTIARQKADLKNKISIAEAALDTYINYAKPVHERYTEVSTKLGILRREEEKLEAEIAGSKLGKEFNKLKNKYQELVSNKSILNKSQAYLVSLRLNAIYYSGLRKEFNKLNTIKKEIEKLHKPWIDARDADVEAYRQEHELIKIVGDLQSKIEDLRTQERMLNRAQGNRSTQHTKNKKGGSWSLKYKRSIDCKNPRGFSQKQYCKYGKHI